jgi:hypothetical protein
VDELDGDGALADGRGHALDGPVAHVAGGEHPGQAGFQEQRRAGSRPLWWLPVVGREVSAGQHIHLPVAGHDALQPVAAGLAADEHEQGRRRDRLRGTPVAVAQGQFFQASAAVAVHHLGAHPDGDLGVASIFFTR